MRNLIYSVLERNYDKEPSYVIVNRDGSIDISNDIRIATSFLASDFDAMDDINKIINKIREKHPERKTCMIGVDKKVLASDRNYWENININASDIFVN